MPCRFKLINYRADVRFSLITGGLGSNLQAPNFTIIAQSPIITNTAVNQPVQVRCPHILPWHTWKIHVGSLCVGAIADATIAQSTSHVLYPTGKRRADLVSPMVIPFRRRGLLKHTPCCASLSCSKVSAFLGLGLAACDVVCWVTGTLGSHNRPHQDAHFLDHQELGHPSSQVGPVPGPVQQQRQWYHNHLHPRPALQRPGQRHRVCDPESS